MKKEREAAQKRRLQHQLEIQSMQIERVFDRHQMPAQVEGGTVRSRSISFDLQAQLNTGWERLRSLKQDLMAALDVSEVYLSRDNGRLSLHVVRSSDPPVSLLDLLPTMPTLPPVTATLGIGDDKRPILLDFDSAGKSHILLSGGIHAGKTTLLRTLALSLALTNRQSQLQLLVIQGRTADGATTETTLSGLDYLPHLLTAVIYQPEEAVEILNFLVEEMGYRSQQGITTPTIVVLIDGVVSLLTASGQPGIDAITRLVQRGAEAGIHLVLSTRQPSAGLLGPLLKANLPLRLVGQVTSEQEARAATGLSGTQAEFLLGQGDFLMVSGETMTHFQAAYVGDYDLHLCLEELHRKRPPALLAQPTSIRPTFSLESAEDEIEPVTPQSFSYDGSAVTLTQPDETANKTNFDSEVAP